MKELQDLGVKNANASTLAILINKSSSFVEDTMKKSKDLRSFSIDSFTKKSKNSDGSPRFSAVSPYKSKLDGGLDLNLKKKSLGNLKVNPQIGDEAFLKTYDNFASLRMGANSNEKVKSPRSFRKMSDLDVK